MVGSKNKWTLAYDFSQITQIAHLRRSSRFVDIGEIPIPKPRDGIQINAVIHIEGLMGKSGKGHLLRAPISEIADKPPDYDFVIFRKSRPEVVASPL